jgi:hypothetical protein
MKSAWRTFLSRLSTFVRIIGWLAVTSALVATIAVLSISGAVVSGLCALVLGWWARSDKKVGAVVGIACFALGLIIFLAYPEFQARPLASCSALPIPFVQFEFNSPQRSPVPAAPQPTQSVEPWVSESLSRTNAFLSIIAGANERIYLARAAAIEYARDTGASLVALDALLSDARSRLQAQFLSEPTDQARVRDSIAALASELAKSNTTRASFEEAWAKSQDVQRVADVAHVLTNLDNEIASLFNGIETPGYFLTAELIGRDLIFREIVSVKVNGGRLMTIDATGLVDAARQRGIVDALPLWSPGPTQALKAVTSNPIDAGGTSSGVIAIEWTVKRAVVDTCRRLSFLPFQGINVSVPSSYKATLRGTVLPNSKAEPVPVVMQVTANNVLKEIRVPADSLYLSNLSLEESEPVGSNGEEQVLGLKQPVTAESIRATQFWIEMLPPPLRIGVVQSHRRQLFPANIAVTLILIGLSALASLALVPAD